MNVLMILQISSVLTERHIFPLAFIRSHQAAPHITHESIWVEESRFSGSSGVGSGYVWSNTAVNTALFAG